MVKKFEVLLLQEVKDFFDEIDNKAKQKILYNIKNAQVNNDPRLLKKLTSSIWEFRTKYGNLQYRLFAFCDKSNELETLVVATHGMIKKTDKVPGNEIEKSEMIRMNYFKEKKI